ncbi:hypothetical protein LTS13_011142 [Exophiala xenobiotica]|nr:hypothetical protein LTS13_011142 [Exophiala xenobiotica]KAK5469997.1 hypothetical protein LTR26_011157 [Exophiala xenobiotica]KAK5476813.1 hypothetical protein LTR83_011161 [Exophiala xenobiotica]
MDEADKALSKESQELAARKALQGDFSSQEGWVSPDRPPLWVNEREKLTITRTFQPLQYCLGGRNKALAVITSPILENCLAMSGWKDNHPRLPIIKNSVWTAKVCTIAAEMGIPLPKHSLDPESAGKSKGMFYASHAEAKLMALYLDFRSIHAEALQYLASISRWNPGTLDIDVSKEPCRSCREIARKFYEKHDVKVNFTFQGRLDYPHCKNYYCDQQLLDGSRNFCCICQTQIESLPMTAVYLPQMDAKQFQDFLRGEAKSMVPFAEQEEAMYDFLRAVTEAPSLGLHLYHENQVSEIRLTVIVPNTDTNTFKEAVEDRLKGFGGTHEVSWLEDLKDCARLAMAKLFVFLADNDEYLPGSSIGCGYIGGKAQMFPSQEAARRREEDASTFDDVVRGLGLLLSTSSSHQPVLRQTPRSQ